MVNIPKFKYDLLESHWIGVSSPVLDVSTWPATIVASFGKSTVQARSDQARSACATVGSGNKNPAWETVVSPRHPCGV